MPDNDRSLSLYRQRRSVELLRQTLFSETDPEKMQTIMQALATAEQELRRLEKQGEETEKAGKKARRLKRGTDQRKAT